MREIKTLQGDSLDLIAWREYGAVFGYVEELIKINPHLLHLESFSPGLDVFLAELYPQKATKIRRFGD